MGSSRIKKEIENQKVKSFYDLRLFTETTRYIYRITAYKIIMKNPRDYGFFIREQDFYKAPKTKNIKVSVPIADLVEFAEKYGTNIKVLKILNPWLRGDKLTNSSDKTYFIKVPVEDGRNIYKKTE